MADRIERFDERARKVLQLAQEEAQRFNHTYIGTEHLLLGLLAEGQGVAARTLGELGADLQRARTAFAEVVGPGDEPPGADVGLTSQAKRAIEQAVAAARRLRHHEVNTGHLLLGLLAGVDRTSPSGCWPGSGSRPPPSKQRRSSA